MLKLVLCGAMALVLGRASLAAPQLELSLRDQAAAGAQRMLLGDVADYAAGSEQLWQALSAEPLCLPPVAGASVTLAARDILGLLAQRGYDWRAIQLSGAAQVTISSGSYCAAPADIVTLVQAETETQLGTTVSLELLRDLPAVRLASPPDKTKVRFPSKPGWWLPEAVEFYSAGRLQAVIPLTQYVKFTLQTVVTPAGIPARTLIRADQLGMQEMTLAPGSEVAPSIDGVCGLTSRGSIAAGQRVLFSRLRAPFDVARGGMVTLLIEFNGISLSAQAVALNDAYIGQTLCVTRTDDGMKYTGLLCAGPVVVVK